MYKDHFHLAEMPFSIAPDPRFLFMSARHREALAHLMYGLTGEGGFVLLTGEVGTGKTTLCRCLLEQIPENCDVAFIMNPRLSAVEMLATVCDEFHLAYPPGTTRIKVLTDFLNDFLLQANAAGRKAVLIVDEAQNLDPDVLEQLRLLTNLETHTRKLLQIVLLGQPELLALLQRPELRQVAQRVVARYHLTHLSKAETAAYVAHRLHVAGARPGLIPETLAGRLHRISGGIPRLINVVCDRALLGAYVESRPQVTAGILRKAAAEVLGTSQGTRRWPFALAATLALVAGGAAYLELPQSAGTVAPASESAAGSLAPLSTTSLSQGAGGGGEGAAGASKGEAPVPTSPTVEQPKETEYPNPAASLPVPEAAPDTLALPPGRTPEEAEATAYHALLARYGVEFKPLAGLSACRYAESFGLRCLAGRGDLETLRRYNQPVVLQLRGKPRPYPVVLARLTGETGTFLVGGEERRVAMSEVQAQWTGDYQLLWRPPPGYVRPMEPGQHGPAVAWLRDALATTLAQRGGPGVSAASFDPSLSVQVKSFQAREGLTPDGVAGPLTLIRLNLALDARLARLVSEATEKGGA